MSNDRSHKVIKGNCPECQFEPAHGHSPACSKVLKDPHGGRAIIRKCIAEGRPVPKGLIL